MFGSETAGGGSRAAAGATSKDDARTGVTTIVDDAKLEQLAAGRPKDLFPLLERSASLSPLLVILTVLPGLVAFRSSSMDDQLSRRQDELIQATERVAVDRGRLEDGRRQIELDARWHLKSLELSSVSTVFDAVDPAAASTQTPLKWQPPLGSWIGAAAVHLPWPIGVHGLAISDYLAAAALVPAIYLLASRLIGRRIGLLAATLAAFHVTFLEQSQHAAPHALAVLTALFAFWGFLGHLWNANGLVSIDLLCGGVSLGLCLLAGGPLSLVVVAVLVLFVGANCEPPPGARRGTAFRGRRTSSGWAALRSMGVMIVTAFAAGGWWELMMLYSYGTEFLSGWMSGAAASAAAPLDARGPVTLTVLSGQLLREFLSMTSVLSGFTMLGLFVVGRTLVRPSNGGSRASYVFLALWAAAGFTTFAIELRDPSSDSLYFGMWRLFLMAACAVYSAVAIDEIARRRIGLSTVVGFLLATLLCGYVVLRARDPFSASTAWRVAAALIAAAIATHLLYRFCEQSEKRRRLVLIALIVAQVLADASIGVAAVRNHDPDSEALSVFRRSLPSGIDVDACVIISESPTPYQLQVALKSVWPSADLSVVRDWDEALKIAFGTSQTPKSAIVVDWSQGNSRPANPTGARWEAAPIGNPQFFENRQLRGYVLVWE